MALFKNLVGKLCLFSLLCSATSAAPLVETVDELDIRFNETNLVKRVPGDKSNPIDATFDTTGWPNIAEEDCFAMLCLFSANRVYQRNPTSGAGDANYRASGATYTPFQMQNLAQRHTSQINSQTTSAEEFPWESTVEGGEGAYVFPATQAEQTAQGAALTARYNANGGPQYNQFFRINFVGAPHGTYCAALFSNPPDTSVCGNNQQMTLFGTVGVFLANFVYQVVKAGPTPYAFIHGAGQNKGKYTKRSEGLEILAREADDKPIEY